MSKTHKIRGLHALFDNGSQVYRQKRGGGGRRVSFWTLTMAARVCRQRKMWGGGGGGGGIILDPNNGSQVCRQRKMGGGRGKGGIILDPDNGSQVCRQRECVCWGGEGGGPSSRTMAARSVEKEAGEGGSSWTLTRANHWMGGGWVGGVVIQHTLTMTTRFREREEQGLGRVVVGGGGGAGSTWTLATIIQSAKREKNWVEEGVGGGLPGVF